MGLTIAYVCARACVCVCVCVCVCARMCALTLICVNARKDESGRSNHALDLCDCDSALIRIIIKGLPSWWCTLKFACMQMIILCATQPIQRAPMASNLNLSSPHD